MVKLIDDTDRRFALSRHTTADGGVHFDLFLELPTLLEPPTLADRLATWRFDPGKPTGSPPKLPGSVLCRRLPDHRPLYLEFSGELSGNRGAVERLASGVFSLKSPSSLTDWPQNGVELQLDGDFFTGERLVGLLSLQPLQPMNDFRWQLTFRPSPFYLSDPKMPNSLYYSRLT